MSVHITKMNVVHEEEWNTIIYLGYLKDHKSKRELTRTGELVGFVKWRQREDEISWWVCPFYYTGRGFHILIYLPTCLSSVTRVAFLLWLGLWPPNPTFSEKLIHFPFTIKTIFFGWQFEVDACIKLGIGDWDFREWGIVGNHALAKHKRWYFMTTHSLIVLLEANLGDFISFLDVYFIIIQFCRVSKLIYTGFKFITIILAKNVNTKLAIKSTKLFF